MPRNVGISRLSPTTLRPTLRPRLGSTLYSVGGMLWLASAACSSSAPPAKDPEPQHAPVLLEPEEPSVNEPNEPAAAEPGQKNEPGQENEPGATNLKTLFVHEARVDCEAERPMRCLQVRESEQAEWSYFYGRILGFDYEESYRYELRVELDETPDRRIDGPTVRYRLVEIVSKTPAAEAANDD